MDKELATQLMECFTEVGNGLNDAAALIEQIQDEAELQVLRKGIATIMANIYTELERPIIMQFPDLDPDVR